MQRHCARPGCATTASATLTYDYAAGTVWIDVLSDEAHPMTHDMCARHADSLRVPRGWLLQDRRVTPAPLFTERVGSERHVAAGYEGESYRGGVQGSPAFAG